MQQDGFKLVINAIPLLSPLTGIGRYTYEISKRIFNDIDEVECEFYYGFYSNKLLEPNSGVQAKYVRIKDVIKKIPIINKLARRVRGFLSSFSRGDYDIYFEPNFIPLDIPARHTVVTVPDFSFLNPEWHPRERVEYFSDKFFSSICKADHIVCISDFIRDTAIQEHGFSPEKLTTIHLGFDSELFKRYPDETLQEVKSRLELPEHFILFVGSIEPRKNLINLIRAYMQISPEKRRDFKLVLAGFKGWNNAEIMTLLKELEDDVIYLGYVSIADLACLYNLATFFAFPSHYEGFGLPAIEAMACGCPVLSSNTTSLPEVCGDAAEYIDPDDVENIARKMEFLIDNETRRENLSAAGVERAQRFSWEKSAQMHVELFKRIISG